MVIFSPFAHSVPDQIQNNQNDSYEVSGKLEKSSWKSLENPIQAIYEIPESSGFIHSPFGIFDPLLDDPPLGPWREIGLHDPFDKRLHIVQSKNSLLNHLLNSK